MTPLLKSYVPLVKHQPSSPSSCARSWSRRYKIQNLATWLCFLYSWTCFMPLHTFLRTQRHGM